MSDYRISDSGRILPGGMENEIHRLPMRLAGVALMAMAAIGWVSLMTWSISDPSVNRATGSEPSNLLGATGASLADMLFQTLGLGSIALFLPPAAWGLALIVGETIPNPRHRLAMWSLSLMLIASALSFLPKPERWLLVHGLGGLIGDFGKSFFLAIGGFINERIAATVGGLISAFFGLWALSRACGLGRHELRMMAHVEGGGPGRGRNFLLYMLAGLSSSFFWVFSLPRRLISGLARETDPRRVATPYWQPEEPDRFAAAPRRAPGSFNPRHSGYQIIDEEPEYVPPRISRPSQPQFAHPDNQARDGRIEPYFDNMRVIPRQQQGRHVSVGFVPRAPSAMPPPQQQWQAPPPRRHSPCLSIRHRRARPRRLSQCLTRHTRSSRNIMRRTSSSRRAYPPQHGGYANENYDAQAYPEQGYDEDPGYYEEEAAYEPPPRPPAAVFRGPRPAPAQPVMPERSSRPTVDQSGSRHVEAEDFVLPPLKLLSPPPPRQSHPEMSDVNLGRRAEMLQSVLEDFRIKGQITGVHPGPVITLYEFEPARGTKSSRVIGLADDIARSMSAVSARVAVIPGRDAIGIELPNQNREVVYLRELLELKEFAEGKGRLQLALGKTIGGDPVIVDLARMPHLLIAGTTGSGKSVAINTMILSLLYRLPPEECRFIMIDPKMLELSVYDGIPHLLTPVVTDPHQAIKALKWTVAEMNTRYERMCKVGVRNIMGFNQKVARARRTGEPLARTVQTGFDEDTGSAIYERENIDPTPMPYIVVVIDEMADLMMVAGKDIEFAVQRLSQMARAAGIHLIMATQRPSVDVITGTIKANFPSRISFQVTSKIDSRTILGEMGAEQLLGAGDMLTMAAGGRIMRAHGPFVSDDEVESIVGFLGSQGEPDYVYGVLDDGEAGGGDDGYGGDGASRGASGDEVYDQAIEIVLRDRRPTTSYLQRRLGIGYNRAASLIERMEADGIISAPNRTGKREVIAGEQS